MPDTRIVEMVAGDEIVYTLSRRFDFGTKLSTSLVQAWSCKSGELLWEYVHASGDSPSDGVNSALYLDEKLGHLRVLDNTLSEQPAFFVLEASKGTELVHIIATELVEFLPPEVSENLSGSEDDLQLQFLQILGHNGDDGDTAISPHAFSGCISVQLDDLSSADCQFTFVVDLKLSGLKKDSRSVSIPKVHVFPGFSSITNYRQVHALITSTKTAFDHNDIIVSTSVTESGTVTVTAVNLASATGEHAVGTLQLSTDHTVTPMLLSSDGRQLDLVLSICSPDSCSVTAVDFKGDGAIEFRNFLSCHGSSSVIASERFSVSTGLSSAATCVSLSSTLSTETTSAGTCTKTDDVTWTLTASGMSSVTSSKATHMKFEYNPTLAVTSAVSSTMSRIRNAFTYRYNVVSSGDERLKVLVLSSSGSLHLFQKRGDDKSNALQWSREEALAKVTDSVIVDGVLSDPVGHKRVERLGGKIPPLNVRLRMQFFDLQDLLLGWISKLRVNIDMLLAGQKSAAADRPTLEAFGFNKVAVMFTSMCNVETSSFTPSQMENQQKNCLDGFKVYGLDLITGDVVWMFEPVVSPFLSGGPSETIRTFGRLLNVRPHVHGSQEPEIALLLSVQSVENENTALLSYSFNPHTGERTSSKDVCSGISANSAHRYPDRVHAGLGYVSSVQLYNGDSRGSVEANTFLLVHKVSSKSTTAPFVSFFPNNINVASAKQRGVYTQTCNSHGFAPCDSLVSYRVNFQETLSPPPECLNPPTLYLTAVAGSVVFTKHVGAGGILAGESVVNVHYPTVGDPIHSRAKVLGDNSLLLKYLNPHLVAVVTEKIQASGDSSTVVDSDAADGGAVGEGGISLAGEEISTAEESTPRKSSVESDNDPDVNELFVNVIDTVSAQVVYRYSILHASTRAAGLSSVQVCWIENNLFVSYWSGQAQRQELSSVSLFEGMIDKYGLGPFSSVKVDQKRSSFNSPQPIALQKTFILPRKVTSMSHTVTERGITNKNLLLGLGGGQILTVDLRMLDPRRPANKPNAAEMEEKLMQYVPFIPIHPFQVLSTNSTLPPVQRILSAPSKLESTSIVVSLGLDVYHTRTVPSKGFDMLASDFNKPLLTLILLVMGTAVVWLRRAYKKQLLSAGWK